MSDRPAPSAGEGVEVLNTVLTWVFFIEIVLKLIVYQWAFFQESWNIFDFVIVILSIIFSAVESAVNPTILRSIRCLRIAVMGRLCR